MEMLVLGGTGLAGSAIVRAALDRGHAVTVVHRGGSSARRMPIAEEATSVVLDRQRDGHAALASDSHRFDAVIDNSGYHPPVVRDALATLYRPGVHWCYVSSMSVSADGSTRGQDESAPVLRISHPETRDQALADPMVDVLGSGLYGEYKALCEDEVRAVCGDAAMIVRPCVIAGAGDATWRFAYWTDRARRGGTIAAPLPRDLPAPVLDARDLAAFIVDGCERSIGGTFTTAPEGTACTIGDLVDGCRAAFPEVESDVAWLPESLLAAHNVEPWSSLPLWLPESTGEMGMSTLDTRAAQREGLTCRPIAETAAWVGTWLASQDAESLPDRGTTLTADAERELLATYEAGTGGS